jgi:hypothetical protein
MSARKELQNASLTGKSSKKSPDCSKKTAADPHSTPKGIAALFFDENYP